jgi:hypothetical protein
MQKRLKFILKKIQERRARIEWRIEMVKKMSPEERRNHNKLMIRITKFEKGVSITPEKEEEMF